MEGLQTFRQVRQTYFPVSRFGKYRLGVVKTTVEEFPGEFLLFVEKTLENREETPIISRSMWNIISK
jgi:hypothetical protein